MLRVKARNLDRWPCLSSEPPRLPDMPCGLALRFSCSNGTWQEGLQRVPLPQASSTSGRRIQEEESTGGPPLPPIPPQAPEAASATLVAETELGPPRVSGECFPLADV